MSFYTDLAVRKVKEAGGSMTFLEYDEAMENEHFAVPAEWALIGWGLTFKEQMANNHKQCAFAACDAGLLVQTKTGYEVKL